MIGEIAAKAAEATVKTAEVAKEAGKAVEKSGVDIKKRIDVTKNIPSGKAPEIDITKRIKSEVAKEISGQDIKDVAKDYISDLKSKSVYPDTIKTDSFDASKLEKISPEENAKMREEFDDNKSKLREEWSKINNKEWPRYKEDVFNQNGVRIRKAGDCLDAHHVQPLELGGKNEASNITPMDLNKHKEIHSKDGSCTKLVESVVGGR